jgi:hypothetical protein
MEKYGLSFEELEGQNAELLPDRIEMRRRNRRNRRNRGGGFVQDCDAAQVATGVLNIPLLNNNAAVCLDQKY